MDVTSLKDIQEAMIKIIGTSEDFHTYKLHIEDTNENTEVFAGIDPQRLKVYSSDIAIRRMNLTKNYFALTLRVLGKKESSTLVDKYWASHKSCSFNPGHNLANFPTFVLSESSKKDSAPYIGDLAEYEWMRRTVLTDATALEIGTKIDIAYAVERKNKYPVINASLRLRRFDYPVHTIASRVASRRWQKHSYAADEYYIAAYQDTCNRTEIRIQELGEIAHCLLISAMKENISYDALIQQAIALIPEQKSEQTVSDIVDMLNQFEQCGIFLGAASISDKVSPDA